MLGESTNSVSKSSMLIIELEANVGVLESDCRFAADEISGSPDSNSGAIVAETLFSNAFVEVGTISLSSLFVFVNSIEARDVGNRLICSVKEAGRMSVFVSSWLVIIVLSPLMDVVQYVKVVKKVTLGCTTEGRTVASAVFVTVSRLLVMRLVPFRNKVVKYV
jgi:hypothetical protein